MRIDWTEYDLSEAAVTRGILRWKRRAIVQLVHGQWRYSNSGFECEPWLSAALFRASNAESEKRRYEEDWQPVRAQRLLPTRTL